jgi:N-acetyl-anhydromuramyl-L-alanine amidase AmpD/uncharacterized protein YraI
MRPTRRRLLQLGGAAAAGSLFVGGATPVSAHERPAMEWKPAHESNYQAADRERDYDIRWYVIHVAQGSYSSVVDWFKNPDANVSSHYVIRNDETAKTAYMVDESDVAWHAGGTNYNEHSLGVEHGGFVDETFWTDAVYEQSGRIAQWAAERFDFPLRVRRYDVAPCDARLGDGGVIGHIQVPELDCNSNTHTDPGTTWNWGRFEGYLRRFHLDVGGHCVTNDELPVRAGAGTGNDRVDVAPEGTPGTVTEGPVDDGGYRWYKVDYDGDISEGWSTAASLLYSRFAIDHATETRTALSVREGPSTEYARIDTSPSGNTGATIEGPVFNDGWTWWKVDWDDSTETGWSVDYYQDPVHEDDGLVPSGPTGRE